MYEILGVNVVDTFPQSIAAEFRRVHRDNGHTPIASLAELFAQGPAFDPDNAFSSRIPQ